MLHRANITVAFYSHGGFVNNQKTSSAGDIHVSLQGLIMVIICCTNSGIAGVYSEYILKNRFEVWQGLWVTLQHIGFCATFIF